MPTLLPAVLKVVLLSALNAVPEAQAGTPEFPVWFGGLVNADVGVGSPSTTGPGGGVQGFVGAEIGKVPARSFALEGRVGEGVNLNYLRTVGNVDFDVRYPAGNGPFAFVGFAHHHELDIDEASTHVVGTVAATYPGITHRTGFELGVGWDAAPPFPDSSFGSRVRPTARLNVVVLPDGVTPPVYVVANVGVMLGVGKRR